MAKYPNTKIVAGKRYYRSGTWTKIPSIKRLRQYHAFVYDDLFRKVYKRSDGAYEVYYRTKVNEKKYRSHLKKRKSGLLGF